MGLLGRRKPAFQLTGLAASPDGLYDNSFVIAAASWWNHEVEARAKLRSDGHRPLEADDVHRLCAVVQPENRRAFEVVASTFSVPGRFSAAILSLAYALALVVEAGASQPVDDETVWSQARPFTDEELTELERHYSKEGDALEYETWEPYWMSAETFFDGPLGPKLAASARSVFDDQVDRWATAEGINLRQSIGGPDWSLIAFKEETGLLNFVQLLFEWGGRLRLGERLIARGNDLADFRFGSDNTGGFIDHLYEEAFERYLELASKTPPPVSDDVLIAARMCGAWLGEKLDDRGRFAVSTTAIRAYIWRTVEGGPVDFLEPGLTEAVEQSYSIGDDRADDEQRGITYYFAASQCMVDHVNTRLGSIGGLINGPRSYERALCDTTEDFEEQGLDLDEYTKRQAFNFGICLADAERVMGDRVHMTYLPNP